MYNKLWIVDALRANFCQQSFPSATPEMLAAVESHAATTFPTLLRDHLLYFNGGFFGGSVEIDESVLNSKYDGRSLRIDDIFGVVDSEDLTHASILSNMELREIYEHPKGVAYIPVAGLEDSSMVVIDAEGPSIGLVRVLSNGDDVSFVVARDYRLFLASLVPDRG